MYWQTYLFLLHEFRVRYIVRDVFAEDGGGHAGVDVFGVDVFGFAVQDESIPLGTEIDGHFSTEEDEGEDIAVLLWGTCQLLG